ncbi:NADH-ubiquinone oxidoreductase-F iron-sulfur binding region domain-containing protein [Cryobacterium sp. SO2]|uniref:NADH-ubiquinone oxidoreductase-F iron-sulfur binding region domain-containing protein n=1 Tax=Cryobacterium sp. SO2 TaxID=1897060 RepID=UPI00223CC247|nr:NADH-ubiquinone oxidoreductase-F iron-sulfur binding region domain-containing protein [Cryobacterium sp. SO2]WEO78602.1 NADH-ubiquinone oxidoreductase-F iron-sulfur binding region domain-containing protein [Cryobacterium sp. SO2]
MTIVTDAPRQSPNDPDPIPAPLGTSRLTRAAAPDLGHHLAVYGALPAVTGSAELLETLRAAGLEGRGGAGFPAWRKLAAVPAAARSRAVVIGNAAEGEPLSIKDATLLRTAPHLVIDGLLSVAAAVNAAEAYLYAPAALLPHLGRALAERSDAGGVQMRAAAESFVSGEASAVVNALAGRPAVPRDGAIRLTTSGLGKRPTLLHNIETLAQIALIVRFGATWFRSLGTATDPGTRLVTVSRGLSAAGVAASTTVPRADNCVPRTGRTSPLRQQLGTEADAPGHATATVPTATVLEVVGGSSIDEVLRFAGVDPSAVAAVLVGGYHGAWLPGEALHTGLDRASLAPFGANPGAGILFALETGRCPLTLAAAIADYLAGESAGQCGPCVNGLPAMAGVLGRLAAGDRDPRLPGEVARLAALVTGRGSCHHPDGTARFVLSTLTVFEADVAAHLHGSCAKAHS